MSTFSQSAATAFDLVVSNDPVLWAIVARSLGVSASACLIACALGLLMGAWLGVARFVARDAVLAVLNALLATPQAAGPAAVVRSGALVAPELARAKQSLEAFPLDAMTMVGSLRRVGQPVALLRVNSLIYQVRTGDYLGQNFGRVQKISETSLALREIVQDASGEWVERAAILQLQGMSK